MAGNERNGQAGDAAAAFNADRVHAAIEGTISASDLSRDEQAMFFELLGESYRASGAALAAELLQEPGNVGYDEVGNLVRTLGGGKVEIIEAAG